MTVRANLTRGVALGACAAVAAGGAAQAAPHHKHHHHHGRTPPPLPLPRPDANAELVAEIRALRTEVLDLKGRLDGQAQSAQAARDQAAVAESRADVAVATAKAAEDDVKRVPATVRGEIEAIPKPKTGWWGDTSASGLIYYDLSDIDQRTNTGAAHTSGKVAPSGPGFDIKRSYIGVTHRFSDTYSANVTLDAQYSSSVGATEIFIKKAYLQAHYSDALTVRLGSADMPWIPFVEDIYGYRYVEQTIIDRTKFGAAADWGAHLLGKFADGKLNYQISIVNGAGYKTPGMPGVGTQGRSQQMDVEARVNANLGPFIFAIDGYDGKLGKDSVVAPPAVAPVEHEARRFDALAAYVTRRARLGVEYFRTDDWGVTSVDKADGWSTFGSYKLNDRWSVFARDDRVSPNKLTAPKKVEDYYNFGIAYSAAKNLDFALVAKRDRVDAGTFATGNGTIGGGVDGTYSEVGLFGQVRW